jgi:DNA mismatch endonuclease (patch repair protein)
MVLPRYHVAVFVDGCFWHGCPEHGPTEFRGANADRWRAKLAVNRARDLAANDAIAAAGWRVLRIWECAIKAKPSATARKVASFAQAEPVTLA